MTCKVRSVNRVGACFAAHSDNRVGGNVQVFRTDGGVGVAGKLIDGKLQCTDSRPAPIGGGKRVRGNKEDQCSRL